MKYYTQCEVKRILKRYNPEHDSGGDAPVTWREEILANVVLELEEQLEKLEVKVSAILDALPSAKVTK